MQANRSPLQLLDFYLVQHQYDFIKPEEDEEIHVPDHFENYEIDIDFGQESIDDQRYSVSVKIEINNTDNPVSGYSIYIEGVGIFQLAENELSEEANHNLKTFSSVNIVINQLRNIITTQTSFGPLGKLILPPIDISDLFQKKDQQIKEQNDEA